MHRARLLGLTLALVPSLGLAAGFEVPENGALPIARAGTTTALLDTAYAVAFNPAGLSLIDGLDVRLDYRFVDHAVTFQRAPAGTMFFEPVENSAGIYAAPFVSLGYGRKLGSGRLGVGLGVFGPAGIGAYKYPRASDFSDAPEAELNPDYPSEMAGHRYAQIEAAYLIALPSLAVSWAPRDDLSFGVTFTSTYADIAIQQAIGASPGSESYKNDVLVGVDVVDPFSPTFTFGALWQPTKSLRLSGYFRPKTKVHAEGSLDLAPGEDLAKSVNIGGNQTATLELYFPAKAKLGASFDHELFTAGLDLIYEGWSANELFVLTPDVEVSLGDTPVEVESFDIQKNWKDSFGARLGGTFKAVRPAKSGDFFLHVHAGGLFETNAIPPEWQGIDYVTGDRLGGSLGLTVGYKGFALTASGMLYLPVRMEITNSKVERSVALPENPPIVIGNGVYTSDVWLAGVGLSYTGLGSAK